MKQFIVFVCLLFVVSCSANFFGAKATGNYTEHYDGKIRCAFVDGWHKTTKCLCVITEADFSENKTFLVAEDWMCNGVLY